MTSQERKEKYRAARNAGQCTICGSPTSKSLCDRCAMRERENRNKLKEKRIRAGLCAKCGINPAEEGKQICAECSGKRRNRYYSLKQEGLCVTCGKNPAEPGRVLCQSCAIMHSEAEMNRQSMLRMNGLCIRCKKPCTGAYCPECSKIKQEQRYARRLVELEL